MGRIFDINNNAEMAIMADISDYAYIDPHKHRSNSVSKSLKYLRPYIDERFYHHGHNYSYVTVRLKPNCIVIAFRGTDRIWTDVDADLKMYFQVKLPFWAEHDKSQIYEDMRKIMQAYPGYHVVFTGHSLGGSEAKLCALVFNKEAVTFDAFSVVELQKKYFPSKKNYSLISNVRLDFDAVSADVHKEEKYGAKHRRLTFANIFMAHSLPILRQKLSDKAESDLKKKNATRASFWREYSSAPIGGAISNSVAYVKSFFDSGINWVTFKSTTTSTAAKESRHVGSKKTLISAGEPKGQATPSSFAVVPAVSTGMSNGFNGINSKEGSMWSSLFEKLSQALVATSDPDSSSDEEENSSDPDSSSDEEENSLVTQSKETENKKSKDEEEEKKLTLDEQIVGFFKIPFKGSIHRKLIGAGMGIVSTLAAINVFLGGAYAGGEIVKHTKKTELSNLQKKSYVPPIDEFEREYETNPWITSYRSE